jgi:hypothetical protein
VEEQIMTIYTGTNGYLDGLEIGKLVSQTKKKNIQEALKNHGDVSCPACAFLPRITLLLTGFVQRQRF